VACSAGPDRPLRARPGCRTPGVAFGVYHLNFTLSGGVNVATVVHIAAGGVVLGLAAHSWQRLGPTIAAHALTNILAVPLVV
jgi:membrane protease YdiL (CAAX protease family)